MIAKNDLKNSPDTNPPAFLSKIVQASIDGIVVTDCNNIVCLWNKQAEAFTGISSPEALGRPISEIMPHTDATPVMLAMERAKAGFTSFIPAEQNPYPSHNYESHYTPVMDGSEVVAVMHLLHDVSHRIKKEQELKSLNDILVQNNHALNRHAAALSAFSHITNRELREPMRKMYTAVELLLNNEGRKLSPAGKEHLRQFQVSLQRINLLTDDMLSFFDAHGENTTDVDLNELLATVMKRLHRNIETQKTIIHADVLPTIYGKKTVLVYLFRQLLSMILRAVKQKGAEIRITHEQKMQGGVPVLFIGIRITKAAQFDEAHLSFCNTLASLHEGWIETGATEDGTQEVKCFLREAGKV